MNEMPMIMPTEDDILQACTDINNILVPELNNYECEEGELPGTVYAFTGGCCVVVPFKKKQETNFSKCLRIWTKELEQIKKRANLVSIGIKNSKLNYYIDYQYTDEAIRVNGMVWPGILMDFSDAPTLADFIKEQQPKSHELKTIRNHFLKLCSDLNSAGIAHGDLSSSNILVKKGTLEMQLIDYDTMYVPEMETEFFYQDILGTNGYQHKERDGKLKAAPNNDYFSQQVIHLCLLAFEKNPMLCSGIGEKELLFYGDDLNNLDSFKNSVGYKNIAALHDKDTDFYLEELGKAINSPLENVKSVCELVASVPTEQQAFDTYKKNKIKEIEGMATASDNWECKRLINNAKQDIGNLQFDSNKTLDDNQANVDLIVNMLKENLKIKRVSTITKDSPFSEAWKKYKKLLGIAALIVAIVCLGIKVTSNLISNVRNNKEQVEITVDHLIPSLEGTWLVTVMDGQRMPINDTGATITAQDADGTKYKMLITSESKISQMEVNFTVNRETGDIISPELGNGHIEWYKEKNIGNQFKISFDKWILEK